MPLTDAACRNAKCPSDKPRARLADSLGLYLEVTPSGGRYFRLKCRHGGKEKRLGLGVYPRVTLTQARKLRDQARELLATGTDPSQARQDARLARSVADANSFEAVARAWHEQWKAARTDHHADYVLRRLEADVFPMVGALPPPLQCASLNVADGSTPSAARRTRPVSGHNSSLPASSAR